MNTLRWDIFCRVVDNFGDIGTCWRLARILQREHGQHVRLWVDDLHALKPLVPEATLHTTQTLHDIEVCHWGEHFPATTVADIVIEAFACGLPQSYQGNMQGSLWLNLEYMSCEDWVPGCHGQSSMLPGGLKRHFFIPSLLTGAGGLLRERDLLRQRDQFLRDPCAQSAWRARWDIPTAAPNSLKISLFAYENPHLMDWLHALGQLDIPVTAYLPQSRLCNSLTQPLKPDAPMRLGNLTLHRIPFLPQAEYDHLLWLCDINFVRGEDSLSRAIWAGKPFIWHIYPTDDRAHLIKLEAFLRVYATHNACSTTLQALMYAWNRPDEKHPSPAHALLALHQQAHEFATQSQRLARELDLAQNLLNTVQSGANTARMPD